MGCDRAWEFFADRVSGSPGAEAGQHLASCADCRRAMEGLEEILQEAARTLEPVPDPPRAYWDAFGPSLRARLARRAGARPPARLPAWAAAAAALVMAASAAGAILVAPRGPAEGGALAAGRRLDEALTARPDVAASVAADMLGIDPIAEVGAGQILETLDEIGRSGDTMVGWTDDDDLQRRLDQLTADQAARLKAELATERG